MTELLYIVVLCKVGAVLSALTVWKVQLLVPVSPPKVVPPAAKSTMAPAAIFT
ncbi:hypothetical protein D3C81_2004860 [compost metagenome]